MMPCPVTEAVMLLFTTPPTDRALAGWQPLTIQRWHNDGRDYLRLNGLHESYRYRIAPEKDQP